MSYTAVVLDDRSREALLERFGDDLPEGWEVHADHMTINLGPPEDGPAADRVGQEAELTVTSLARGETAIAVGVESEVPSENEKPHVTLAVNRDEGGEPEDSNDLEDWEPVDRLTLRGTIREQE